MTIAQVLLEDYDVEISNTRRTLERVPDEAEANRAYAPHQKSMKLGKLAMHCATLPLFGLYVLEDEGLNMAQSQRAHIPLTFTTRAECLARLDDCAAQCRAALAAASDEHLGAPWLFSFGEQKICNDSRVRTFRSMFFNHLIHHTAQLGVYLRLKDLPVPALYGPSADEQWVSQ